MQVKKKCFPEFKKSNFPKSLTLHMRHFKKMKSHYPTSISIPASASEPEICPIRTIFLYLQSFKHFSGPSFKFRYHYSVTHHFITKITNLLNSLFILFVCLFVGV